MDSSYEKKQVQIPLLWGYRPNFKLIEYKSKNFKERVQAYEYSLYKTIEIKHPWISSQIDSYNNLQFLQVIKVEIDVANRPNAIRLVKHIKPNRNLRQIIAQQNIEVSTLQIYIHSLAKQIQALHQAGITHNLIRLQTIFEKGNALQFDIPYFRSVAFFAKDRSSYFVGQNVYCAPEVRLNEQFSKEGDIYALGLVFLQLCTRKVVTRQHQIQESLKQITKPPFKELKKVIENMLDPSPLKRPTVAQIFDFILKKGSASKVDPAPFWNEKRIVVFRRNIFDINTSNEPSVTLKKYENYKDKNYKLRICMLNKDTVRVKISLLNNKNISCNLNFIETDRTISQASQYITSVDTLYCLFEQEHIEAVDIDSSGLLEFSVSNARWFILKVAYQKERFGKLGLTQQVLLFSQKYRNFDRWSGKARRQSLTDEEKKELNELEYFWPQVTEALIDSNMYNQAIVLSKFNIEHYTHIQYNNYEGFGCKLETSGFTIEQIKDYYKQSANRKYKNPYDQLAICSLITNTYQSNRYFLEKMNKKKPENAAILFMLGNYEYNKSNFAQAADYYKQVINLEPNHKKAIALRYLCLFMQEKHAHQNQIVQVLKLFSDQQSNYGFSRIVIQLLKLACDSRSLSSQQINQTVVQIQSKTGAHLKKSVYFIIGSLMENISLKQNAINYYKLYKSKNSAFPQIYRILAQLTAETHPDDLSQPITQYIQWFERFKEMNQKQIFPVTIPRIAKQIPLIDVKSKKETIEVGQAVECIKRSNFSKAISLLQICAQKYETDVPIIFNLGKMYMRNKMYRKAVTYFQKTLQIEPENAIVWYMLGLNYEYLNLEQESRECYERAFELSPHENTFKKLNRYYDQNGQNGQVLKNVEKIILRHPNNKNFYQIKANVLFILGFQGKARLIKQFAQYLAEQNKNQ